MFEIPTASGKIGWDLQSHLLLGVSRTFALTIPQLPEALERAVGNGYLLCRIVDTIEDDPGLALEDKRAYFEQFLQVLNGTGDAREFATSLHAVLTEKISAAEFELVRATPEVLQLTQSLSEPQQQALVRCVTKMSDGMYRFQSRRSLDGLCSVHEMSQYCYAVAGVVGEMLTELFCDYSESMQAHRDEMMPLAICFGQGLQLTNILKDVWEDQKDGSCWLPQSAFSADEKQLGELIRTEQSQQMTQGINHIVGIAHQNLKSAIKYSSFIPTSEVGIRRFCLWAAGMAVATLKKIHQNPGYYDGNQVKISRSKLKFIVSTANVALYNNQLMQAWFKALSIGLPVCADSEACDPRELQQIVSRAGFGDVHSGMVFKRTTAQ